MPFPIYLRISIMLPLEDTHLDLLAKAQRGMKLSDEALLERASLSLSELLDIRNGSLDPLLLEKITSALHLHLPTFSAIAHKTWLPEPIELPHFKTFTTDFDDMTVNAYLVWDPQSNEAIAFDTGSDVTEMLLFATQNQLQIKLILITHTHGDHIFDLDRLMEKTKAPSYLGDLEPHLKGSEFFTAGKRFQTQSLTIETRLTWGHCQGGITYLIHGLSRPLAIVGDALFAGSMGGGGVSWEEALRTNREEILTLSNETVLAPGHGPLTTVGETKRHNPFYSDSIQSLG